MDLTKEYKACTATHPDQPNHDGHARGRKLHYAKDKKMTFCNMLIDAYQEGNRLSHFESNGICKSCLKQINMPTTSQIEASDLDKLGFEYTGDGSGGSLEHLLNVNGYNIWITEIDMCTIKPDYRLSMEIEFEIPTFQHLKNLIKVLKVEL